MFFVNTSRNLAVDIKVPNGRYYKYRRNGVPKILLNRIIKELYRVFLEIVIDLIANLN